MMSKKHWSIETALAQIDKCDFECEAGPLKNNVAYQWLKAAARVGPKFWPGQGIYFEVTGQISGTKVSQWAHFYIVGCTMSSTSEDRVWKYALSNDPPAPWHYGETQHTGVDEAKLFLEMPVPA